MMNELGVEGEHDELKGINFTYEIYLHFTFHYCFTYLSCFFLQALEMFSSPAET